MLRAELKVSRYVQRPRELTTSYLRMALNHDESKTDGTEDASELQPQGILDVYERTSGQVINRDKSSMLFSTNTRQHEKEQVRTGVHIMQETKIEKYLDLLVSIKK